MSILEYIASDKLLPPVDAGEGMHHGEVSISPFDKSQLLDDIYTQKSYCAELIWEYSEERAQQVLAYIAEQMNHVDDLELWHIWLGGLIEEDKKETRPKLKASRTREVEDVDWDDWKKDKVHKTQITFSQLNSKILKDFFFDGSMTQKCLIVKSER